ncbi:MAG: RNA polymerase sporulation sigma factor SigH [bacterium]|nr:RNA polymerase sporulation sigma factor SigH [bacterium]
MPYERYADCSDEEILMLIREEDKLAMECLLERYKHLVRKKAKALFIIGADRDDLIQEGMIGLYKAVRDFREDKNSSFATFAELCISRQIYSAIKTSNRKKNNPLNTYISFYEPVSAQISSNNDQVSSIMDFIGSERTNPEEMVIDKESANMIEYELKRRLSLFERKVLRLYVSGMKYTEIAEVLNKEAKSIDNALQRTKSKLNTIMEEVRSR